MSMSEHVLAFMWISMKVQAECSFGTGSLSLRREQAPKTVETRDDLVQNRSNSLTERSRNCRGPTLIARSAPLDAATARCSVGAAYSAPRSWGLLSS